jgi:hypothetical protein
VKNFKKTLDKSGIICYNTLVKQNSYQNGGDTVNDYILYTQTVLDPSDVIYTDDTQNSYDYADEYQGCRSWYEYQKEWN